MSALLRVRGFCPMGCGVTLSIDTTIGDIVCGHALCPRPDAAQTILNDPETEHIAEFTDDGFTVKHPLRERLDDALLTCDLLGHIQRIGLGEHPRAGRYRVAWRGSSWDWTLA
jgi:hypothetical protein